MPAILCTVEPMVWILAAVGLAISGIYFGIQLSVGFVRIGFGLILMGLLGLASLAAAGSSARQMITGDAPGSIQ